MKMKQRKAQSKILNFSLRFFIFAFFLFIFLSPVSASAAEWIGLVPTCGATPARVVGTGGETTRTYTPCSTCDLAKLVKNTLDFVVKNVALAGVALMLMVGGFQMVAGGLGGSASPYQKGKDTIKNAFIGLAIVLFAWLAVDTIIKFIAQQSLTSGTAAELFKKEAQEPPPPGFEELVGPQYGFWNQIECTSIYPIDVVTKPPPPSAKGGTVAQALSAYQCPAGATTHIVNGEDVCNTVVRQNIENNARNPEGSTLRTPLGIGCLNRSLTTYAPAITEWTQNTSLDSTTFQALLMHESSGRRLAISPAGAVGLGQVLPSTAAGISELRGELNGKSNQEIIQWLQDGNNNIRASALYLRSCLSSNAGNRARAFACYNGGQHANETSVHCNGKSTGVTRWECPFDSFDGQGATCWGANPDNCKKNTGYAATRNYTPAIDIIEGKIRSGACTPTL